MLSLRADFIDRINLLTETGIATKMSGAVKPTQIYDIEERMNEFINIRTGRYREVASKEK